MKKIIIIALLATIGFFAWRILKEPPPVPLTPSQEVEACISKNPIDSKELALICDKYPALVAAKLQNQKIRVSGILQKALVKGVECCDLILELEGTMKRNVSFTSDVLLGKRLKGVSKGSFPRYSKKGRDILAEHLTTTKKDSSMTSKIGGFLGIPKASTSKEVSVERVSAFAFREMEPATLEGVFQYIRPGSVELEWIQTGSF